jgi:hypothetical protein
LPGLSSMTRTTKLARLTQRAASLASCLPGRACIGRGAQREKRVKGLRGGPAGPEGRYSGLPHWGRDG